MEQTPGSTEGPSVPCQEELLEGKLQGQFSRKRSCLQNDACDSKRTQTPVPTLILLMIGRGESISGRLSERTKEQHPRTKESGCPITEAGRQPRVRVDALQSEILFC